MRIHIRASFDEFVHIFLCRSLSLLFCSCLSAMHNLFSFGLINAACGERDPPVSLKNDCLEMDVKGEEVARVFVLFFGFCLVSLFYLKKKLSIHFKETTL